jgi:hypothetical protein
VEGPRILGYPPKYGPFPGSSGSWTINRKLSNLLIICIFNPPDRLASLRTFQRPRYAAPLTSAALFITATLLIYFFLPKNTQCGVQGGPFHLGVDWICVFRPAVLDLFQGRSPYNGLYFNPPWTLVLLSPVALLSPGLGASALAVLCMAVFLAAAGRLGVKRSALVLFLLNPFTWTVARQGNLDWLIALGAVLPPQWGLFLVLTKPQAGIAIVVYWLVEAWRQGGIRRVARVFAPVTMAYAVSFLLYGLWVIPAKWIMVHPLNYSLWPVSIPIGLALLAAALRRREIQRAITASPFLSPYVLTMTYAIALLGLKEWELIAAVAGAWLIWLIAPTFGLYPIRLLP